MRRYLVTIFIGVFLLIVASAVLLFSKEEEKLVGSDYMYKYSSKYGKLTELNEKQLLGGNQTEWTQKGMNVLIYGEPNMSEVKKVFTRLQEIGVNSVAITFPFNQLHSRGNEVFIDHTMTPTTAQLETLIQLAKQYQFKIMIRPIMDEQNLMKEGRWRGQLEPEDVDAWFSSYEFLILHYAELAKKHHVELLSVGVEFNSLQKYGGKWSELIRKVRSVYDGEIIYSFNWDTVDELLQYSWLADLDHVGLDAYVPLELQNGATAQELEDEWHRQIAAWGEALHHDSLIITEAGIVPVAGAHRTPYTWTYKGRERDLSAQANYYEATFQAWEPLVKGIYWWTVTDELDEKQLTYSPLNRQTEQIIKRYFLHDGSQGK